MMNTNKIAKRFAELCAKGDFETAQKELFAKDSISIEPYAPPAFEKETKGFDNILEKGHKFENMVEKMNSISVSEPICAANSFALSMSMDVLMKEKGPMIMTELCV